MKTPDEAPLARRVREIAEGLHSLRWQDPDEKDRRAVEALTEAVCEDRWDLIEAAARHLGNAGKPRMAKPRLREYAESIAIGLSRIKGFEFTKADVLDYLEAVHPEIYAALPAGSSARTEWMRKVCPGIPQHRGAVSPDRKRKLKAIVADGIRMERAGFPYFLGPPDSPNWE